MNAITKLYLKVFLLTGLPFGVGIMIFDALSGNGFSISKFIFLTIFFGIFMSISLVTLHINKLKKQGITEFDETNLAVRQKLKISSTISPEILKSSLEADSVLGKMQKKESNNGLILQSNVRWASWGDKIQIETKEIDNNEFEYTIKSEPKNNFTLVDYGTNYDNISRLERLLKAT